MVSGNVIRNPPTAWVPPCD
ncbi:MAG: hypothetical protein IKE85_06430 [Mogibacterium sp.]|nr:hypothetical protein [Mogibacterium sp.]